MNGIIKEIETKRFAPAVLKFNDGDLFSQTSTILPDNIGYIDLSVLKARNVNKTITGLFGKDGIIIDLRKLSSNGIGNLSVAFFRIVQSPL